MNELNIHLKQLPEDCEYAIQIYEETAFGSKWIFYRIDFDCPYLNLRSKVVSLDKALQILRTLSEPARVVKISRYVPWGTDELLVHKVISCNAKALALFR